MFVYQDGKLYIQEDEVLVGVDYHFDKIEKVADSETVLADVHDLLTPHEAMCRFQISETNSYIYPRKEVVKNESTSTPKVTTRKSTRE